MENIQRMLTTEQLNQLIQEIKAEIRKEQYLVKEILTFNEASEFLTLSKSALYKLTSKKEITYFSPGGKMIYFKKSDLENWIFNSKITSVEGIDLEVEKYLSRNSKNPLS
ncbi:MAG: helix-turn-helix domain-containing protein [Flavobacterium sp.]